ncbi:MAG: hypothetical protein IJ494_00935 [Bacteroides sp.]|nr:hypothetical protein [Bacteroides sp.]
MSKINFQPWVGDAYESGGILRQKILVLGESHYCTSLNEENECLGTSPQECPKLCPRFTCRVMEQFLTVYDGRRSLQSYVCFERAVMGKVLTEEERKQFWNSVLFYNYVQGVVLGGARKKPISQEYQDSEEAFEELLKTYQPDKIIVWGQRLYNAMPGWGGHVEKLTIANGDYTPVWHYTVDGRDIPAMMVYHPSSPQGKAWGYWHEFHKLFLNM